MKNSNSCYACNESKTSKEHFPPKSFFPDGKNLQLKTVPSCKNHNNLKSNDDQYVLLHVCANAARSGNDAQKVFNRSIKPAIERSEKFRLLVANNSISLDNGAVAYPVDRKRFDRFFTDLCFAIFFYQYKHRLDLNIYDIKHCYVDLISESTEEREMNLLAKKGTCQIVDDFPHMVQTIEYARISDPVFKNIIIGNPDVGGSITIIHNFYDVFNVISLLSSKISPCLRD